MTDKKEEATDWGNLKVVDWITYQEAQQKAENGLGGMGGWFGVDRSHDKDETLTDEQKQEKRWNAGHRWKDYLGAFKEEVHPALEELRRSILENNIRCTGSEHQYGHSAVPLWSNDKVDSYSMRAWGDLMAAVYSEKEDKNYSYMDFYC